jgi:hypothetical protein
MSFPGENRSAYYAGGNPPQLMQGQPRAMQGMQQNMQQGIMPPLYAGNQVSSLILCKVAANCSPLVIL